MPAFDQCHPNVVRALQKEDWQLVTSPYRLQLAYRLAYADLEMARGTDGNRELMIIVEVKCFPDRENTTRDLYISIGQYLVYRAILVELQLPHSLYLAVPEDILANIFDPAVMRVVVESQINIVAINLETETVTRWIPTRS